MKIGASAAGSWSGFGQIEARADGTACFVHISDLQASKWLVQGETVSFRIDKTNPRGPGAKDVVRLDSNRTIGYVKRYFNGEGAIEASGSSEQFRVKYASIIATGQDDQVFRSLDVGDEVEFTQEETNDGMQAIRVVRTRDILQRFAAFAKFDDQLSYLADKLAEKEIWHYRHNQNAFPHKGDAYRFPILYNYVRNTLKKVLREEPEKIVFTEQPQAGNFCIINTGLVTQNQEEIYAYFTENRSIQSPLDPVWFCAGFRKASDRDLAIFATKPEPANYFSDPACLIYDHRLQLEPNIDHIINDNAGRFPEEYRTNNAVLANLLEGAIGKALKRVRRNYKAAVPQYYKGNLQLLMPICLASQDRADLALVVERIDKVYRASTVLTLDMACNNARLLARPDREWLDP